MNLNLNSDKGLPDLDRKPENPSGADRKRTEIDAWYNLVQQIAEFLKTNKPTSHPTV